MFFLFPFNLISFHSVMRSLFIIILTFIAVPAYSQQLSSDTWLVRNLSILHDFGYAWKLNTQYKPYRMENLLKIKLDDEFEKNWLASDLISYTNRIHKKTEQDSNQVKGVLWLGVLNQTPTGSNKAFDSNATSLYLLSQFWFRKNFSVEWVLRASSDPKALDHFTPVPREIRRFGMNSAEFDHATLGYQNSWITLQFGRGRQVWGAGLQENLMLSSSSAAYDHLLAEFRYKNLTGLFFTGFLESIVSEGQNNIRYISGHGLQYSNKKNLVLSLSEVSIYYGPNRPFDLVYLNPIVPHVEVELNDRENDHRSNFSNAVWFASLDWMLPNLFRLKASYLIDEFQIDKEDREQNRPDATAFQIKFSKSILFTKQWFTLWGQLNRVGTYTFRHEKPFTTFLSRGLPLGIPTGSDYYDLTAGLTWISPFRCIVDVSHTFREQGDNNLLENKYVPYEQFLKFDFPSGTIKTTKLFDLSILYSYRYNIDFVVNYKWQNEENLETSKSSNSFLFKINYHFPLVFSI